MLRKLLTVNRLLSLASLSIVLSMRSAPAQSPEADRGASLYRAGKCEAAIPVFRSAAPSLLLGRCLMDARQYKPAADAFANYVKSKPDDPVGVALSAKALLADDRGAEAAALLQDFLQRNPAEIEVRNALGDVFLN